MGILKVLFSTYVKNKDLGLLLIRLGIGGSMLIFHGFGKITSGPEVWANLGSSMRHLGVDFLPVGWGFMAAFAESFCSLLIMLGALFRPATLLLAFNMLVALIHHLSLPADAAGSGWIGASHALELLVIYFALFLTGPGKYKMLKW